MAEAEKNMVFAARLTQQGHKIASMDDLMMLYEKSFSVQTVTAMGALPHPTIQKFAVITVAIVGASRRFLAQITRHQNEVKFMSASLQYSNYTGQADFAVPYSIMTAPAVVRELYLKSCNESMKCYEALCTAGSGHDAAGYATPQGLRNVLLISATPYQWKHIISQRVCRRNTDETRIVLLKVWKELYELSPALFAPSLTGPFCQMDRCLEGKMTCGRKLQADMTPEDILEKDYRDRLLSAIEFFHNTEDILHGLRIKLSCLCNEFLQGFRVSISFVKEFLRSHTQIFADVEKRLHSGK